MIINASKYCKSKRIKYFSISGFDKNNLLNKSSKNFIWINSNLTTVGISQLLIFIVNHEQIKFKELKILNLLNNNKFNQDVKFK